MGACEDEIPLLHLFPLLQRTVSLTETHKKFGVTKSQVIIFLVLYYRGNATMSEIAQCIASSKEQATRAVASLCDNGLVERYEDPRNRTHVYVRLTEAGNEYMQKLVLGFREGISRKLRSDLEEDDMQRLRQAVCTAVEILGKIK